MSTLLLALAALAADLPKRPTTYPVDTRLSKGAAESFRELYVSPDALAAALPPAQPGPATKADLRIENTMTAWTTIAVGDVQVGVLGPLTDALIHDVAAGVYDVTFTLPNGWSYRRSVRAGPEAPPPTAAEPAPPPSVVAPVEAPPAAPRRGKPVP
jgi:hypothetical protein